MELQGILIATGGKENKGKDLKDNHVIIKGFIQSEKFNRFCQEIKDEKPLVAITPTASILLLHEVAQVYVKVLKMLKQGKVKVAGILDREDANGDTTQNIHQIGTGQPVTLRNFIADMLGKGEKFAFPDLII